jgi:hypothetical protein
MTWKTLKSNVKFVAKSKPFAASFVFGAGVLIGWVIGQIF